MPVVAKEKGWATVGVAVEREGARGVATGIPLLAFDRRRGVVSTPDIPLEPDGVPANRLASGVASRADVDCDSERLLPREWVELVDAFDAADAFDTVRPISAPPAKDDDFGSRET